MIIRKFHPTQNVDLKNEIIHNKTLKELSFVFVLQFEGDVITEIRRTIDKLPRITPKTTKNCVPFRKKSKLDDQANTPCERIVVPQ